MSWNAEDVVYALFDYCWFAAPDVPTYMFHGTPPPGGQITFRNGRVGTSTGGQETKKVFYPGWSASAQIGWENNRWEATGTADCGLAAVEGKRLLVNETTDTEGASEGLPEEEVFYPEEPATGLTIWDGEKEVPATATMWDGSKEVAATLEVSP